MILPKASYVELQDLRRRGNIAFRSELLCDVLVREAVDDDAIGELHDKLTSFSSEGPAIAGL